MIKVIHSIWLGSNVPDRVHEVMNTWRTTNPDFEIRLYTNIPDSVLSECPMAKKAMEDGKYAFVSDWYRFYLLNRYGGVYLDTDMELYKNLTPLLLTCDNDMVLCCYENKYNISGEFMYVNRSNSVVTQELLKLYRSLDESDRTPIPHQMDKIIPNMKNNTHILPQVYFHNYSHEDHLNGVDVKDRISSESYGNHLWFESWKN